MKRSIASYDTQTLEQLLAEDVRATSDAGGEFLAARKVVESRDHVIALFRGINKGAVPRWFEFRSLNGEPALLIALHDSKRRTARNVVTRIELDQAGRIIEVQLVLASRKLTAVDFGGPRAQPVH